MNRFALFVIVGAVVAASFASTARTGATDACTAAKAKVAADQKLIARLVNQRANVTNVAGKVNPGRAAQIAVQIAREQVQLAKDQAAQKAACGADVADFDGTYSGPVPGTGITLAFTVTRGAVTGDLTNGGAAAFSAKTGNTVVQSAFPGLECGKFTLHFDAKAGTARANDVTCKIAGQSGKANFVANRQ